MNKGTVVTKYYSIYLHDTNMVPITYTITKNQEQNTVFEKLAEDVRQLKLEDVYGDDGNIKIQLV